MNACRAFANLISPMPEFTFPESAPAANCVFFRTYSRMTDEGRETYAQAVERNIQALAEVGKLSEEEIQLLRRNQLALHSLPSGRWLWVGGTEWVKNPDNFYGAYNCTSTQLVDFDSFSLLMSLAMMGCGTGAVIEKSNCELLPVIDTEIDVEITVMPGECRLYQDETTVQYDVAEKVCWITVGDSREGWVSAYREIFNVATWGKGKAKLLVNLGNVRPSGEKLKGFGGVANPIKLPDLFLRVVSILNKAVGRKLDALECCLVIDEAASVVVAGNVRRSAGMRQFSENSEAHLAKANLWKQDEEGNWVVDHERDALRMANHTVVYHKLPSYNEILESVRQQFQSGEGAIQFAPEAIARSNADLLNNREKKDRFIRKYLADKGSAKKYLSKLANSKESEEVLNHRMLRYGLNPCFVPGTMVMTRQGHFPIESLVGKTVEIYDGCRWVEVDNFRVTGLNQPVLQVELHSGLTYTVTENHKFILDNGKRIKAKNLQKGMALASTNVKVEGKVEAKGAYLKGFLVGDGTYDKNHGTPSCKIYEPKKCCTYRLVASQLEIGISDFVAANGRRVGHEYGLTDAGYLKNLNSSLDEDVSRWCSVYKHEFPVEVYNWTEKAKLDFIAGLFDADGTGQNNSHGTRYQITSVSRTFLEGLLQLLLTLGIQSKIGPVRAGGKKDWGPDRGGIYNAKDTYRLTIPKSSAIYLASICKFERLPDYSNQKCAYVTSNKGNNVVNIRRAGIAPAVYCCTVPLTHSFTLTSGVISVNCGEICGSDFFCNLAEIHLNMMAECSNAEIDDAFRAGAISVASLLNHEFNIPRYKFSRELDPIVGVSFTGLFDFFVHRFGIEWLQWWEAGRPGGVECDEFKEGEAKYLSRWRRVVEEEVTAYCKKHGLKIPNRTTTVQPAGTKSLLSGASPGWHPPKAQRFIRRITFGKNDPVAKACMMAGYSVIPSQSDKDENGKLLDDPFDPRCTEWLVEIPTEVSWANLEGADQIDLHKFSAAAQFDFYMQVQNYYTTHNTSSTIEFREDEIEDLTYCIYKSIGDGYISSALLARFDANETFPRLPFEPINKETYNRLHQEVQERKVLSFKKALAEYDKIDKNTILQGPAGCDSDKCMLPSKAH